jgi:acetoin utilization deacetylase AcuC-like enzyme
MEKGSMYRSATRIAKMARTGIVKDERYLNHHMGPYHPESPKRLQVLYEMLDESDMSGRFSEVSVRRARKEELLMVHSSEYVDRIASTEGKEFTFLDPDTQTSAGSYEAALLAAGGFCEAVSKVHAGDLDNAFALVRPPGHHAESGRAMGFCLFNNIAVGARYAQKALGVERVVVIDWDLHHGNGTQHTFEDDSTILYVSTHQYPYYPGSGRYQESGHGAGEGFTVNIPLSVGHGDGEYIAIYEEIFKPIVLEFDPDMILVSAGIDIHRDDPLGGMGVTTTGFAGLTRTVLDIADACCGGKAVLTLEGGYSLRGLRDSVKAILNEMAGATKTDNKSLRQEANRRVLDPIFDEAGRVYGRYWKSLF